MCSEKGTCSCALRNHATNSGEPKEDSGTSDLDDDNEDNIEPHWRLSSRNPTSRSGKRDAALKNQQSTGRKRAAKMYPLKRDDPCEWQGKANCGGGLHPILGCIKGVQEARHHGPDKNVTNNEAGNVHRICHACIGRNMKVLTSDLYWVEADKLQVGDELIGFDEDLHIEGKPRLKRTIVTGISIVKEPSYEFTMPDDTKIISSHAHQWVGSPSGRVHPAWRTTESLVKNPTHPNRKYTLRKLFDVWDFNANYDMGWLAGMLDGEGSYSGTQLNIAQKAGPEYERVAELLYRLSNHTDFHREEKRPSVNHESINIYRITHRMDIATILGSCRPDRLINKWLERLDKNPIQAKGEITTIESTRFLGEQEVVSIQTTTKTLIVEGYASHNCHYRWHAVNDATYDWNKTDYPSHNPVKMNEAEVKEAVYKTLIFDGKKIKD